MDRWVIDPGTAKCVRRAEKAFTKSLEQNWEEQPQQLSKSTIKPQSPKTCYLAKHTQRLLYFGDISVLLNLQ